MKGDIIYVCNSINNKNIRDGELEILEINEEGLYFEFGENQMNKKKRFYNDVKTLNKDFEALKKLKNKKENKIIEKNVKNSIENVEKNVESESTEALKINFKKHLKK